MVFKLKRVMQHGTKGKNDEKGDAVVPSASSSGPAGQSASDKGETNNNSVGARAGVLRERARCRKLLGHIRRGLLRERARCRKLLGHIRRGLLDGFSSSDGWSLTTLGAEAVIGVVAEYSECLSCKKGGDLGWFPRGKMAGPFQEVAFNTPRGVLSAPFKSTGREVLLQTCAVYEFRSTKEVLHCVHDQLGLELKLQVGGEDPKARLEKIKQQLSAGSGSVLLHGPLLEPSETCLPTNLHGPTTRAGAKKLKSPMKENIKSPPKKQKTKEDTRKMPRKVAFSNKAEEEVGDSVKLPGQKATLPVKTFKRV